MRENLDREMKIDVIVTTVLAFGPLVVAMLVALVGYIDRALFFLLIQIVIWGTFNLKGKRGAE